MPRKRKSKKKKSKKKRSKRAHKSFEEILDELPDLTSEQADALRDLIEEHQLREYYIGDTRGQTKFEKPCRKSKHKWKPPWKNNITEFPKRLYPRHISFMLYYNKQYPDTNNSHYVLCHRCVDCNRRKKSRRMTGAPCYEGDHMYLHYQCTNKGCETCQNEIDDKVCGKSVVGTVYLSDLETDLVEPHNPSCFGNYGPVDSRTARALFRSRRIEQRQL